MRVEGRADGAVSEEGVSYGHSRKWHRDESWTPMPTTLDRKCHVEDGPTLLRHTIAWDPSLVCSGLGQQELHTAGVSQAG